MKKCTNFTMIAALGLSLLASSALAADSTNAPPTKPGPGGTNAPPVTPKPGDDDRDHGTNAPPANAHNNVSRGTGRYLHQPERNQPNLPQDVKKLIQKFESEREAFLKQQEQLLKQLRGATADEREKLREQIKANRETWLDKQKDLREDIKERLAELRDKLPKHKDAIEDAKEKAGDHKRGR